MSRKTKSPTRLLLGATLARLGQLALPLGVGLLGGYWIGDRGVDFVPDVVAGLAMIAVAASILIIAGTVTQGMTLRPDEEGGQVRRRILFSLGLAALAAIIRLGVHVAADPTPLTGLNATRLAEIGRLDERELAEIDDQLDALLQRLERDPAFATERVLGADEERRLSECWRALLDAFFVVEQIRIFHEDWWRFDLGRRQRDRHVASFLLSYLAEVELFEAGSRFFELIDQNPKAARFLDSPQDELGIDSGSLSSFRSEVLGARDQARIIAGEAYLDWLETAFDDAGPSWLELSSKEIRRHLVLCRRINPLDRARAMVDGDTAPLRDRIRRTWYPAQKEIASAMGNTRFLRAGRYLIGPELIAQIEPDLLPGDIILGRKNWYLSNVGLPGFWPHAIFYVGEASDLLAEMDDPEVTAGLGDPFEEALEARVPRAWREYRTAADPPTVLEAIGPGVVARPLAEAAGDYLVAIRPRLTKLARAQAILEAFSHVGKAYDYEFDFATADVLVCSELVWRAYRPAIGKEGLDLPLSEIAGRTTLPPNEIARLAATESRKEGGLFEIVAFIDAREDEERAFLSDEQTFWETPERSKWDLALN